jgi:hypothetical protein
MGIKDFFGSVAEIESERISTPVHTAFTTVCGGATIGSVAFLTAGAPIFPTIALTAAAALLTVKHGLHATIGIQGRLENKRIAKASQHTPTPD